MAAFEKGAGLTIEDEQSKESAQAVDLKLDRNGLPLVPQPSGHSDDPLVGSQRPSKARLILTARKNWSPALKLSVALQVSWLSFLGPMSSAVANPAFIPIGKAFHITTVEASYSLTMYIIFAAVGPLLAVPLANTYGRRPVYLVGNLVAGICNIAGGFSPSWGGLMATRAFVGIFAGSPATIGPASICDMYFMHERGFYMGIWTFFLTNGPHTASLMGGFIAQYLGWRWCYTIPVRRLSIARLYTTNFDRTRVTCNSRPSSSRLLPYRKRCTLEARFTTNQSPSSTCLFKATLPTRKIKLGDFWRPLYMAKYLTITLPALYYMTCFGYGSVLFASTGSQIFAQNYHFTLSQTGLILSIPLLVGCFIGEASTGWFTDWLVSRYAKRHGGERRPEARLDGLWLSLLVPIGVIIQGTCIYHHKTVPSIGPAIGMGLANLGLQAATTVTYAYTTDYFKPQSAEISCFLNLVRNGFSALISFYAIPLSGKINIEYAWLTFALINVAFFVPVLALKWLGPKISGMSWQAPPTFHNDL
ncbi:hypothetical protein LTR91_015151 [Friedmanniomyces endolithicus]|uniref:Major facilitator superfamily (MFS) profile domain-containing protein n=1 Tax=Friedmanniomyces endolithicus TaxID=329885 RepID=A0AAN6KAD3_9PEZI|nr:hypothetical protein LTR57_007096 [Friedmanniomyces endolithicus]KAK0972429.1 hypothetical protein LTR91_015151 [Friedmanniomyces endolithicus]KAK0996541.1 hypothetical protein LTS01_006334 [Friedmanniomyces endolithicus]